MTKCVFNDIVSCFFFLTIGFHLRPTFPNPAPTKLDVGLSVFSRPNRPNVIVQNNVTGTVLHRTGNFSGIITGERTCSHWIPTHLLVSMSQLKNLDSANSPIYYEPDGIESHDSLGL